MLEDTAASNHRANYNPEFLKRVRERQLELAEARHKKERAAYEARLRHLREENVKLRELLTTAAEKEMDEGTERLIRAKARLSVRDIIRLTAKKHRVRVSDILGPCRSKHIVNARHDAMAEAKRLRPDLSLPQLGKQFGGRDHTTLLSAIKKMGVWQPKKPVKL